MLHRQEGKQGLNIPPLDLGIFSFYISRRNNDRNFGNTVGIWPIVLAGLQANIRDQPAVSWHCGDKPLPLVSAFQPWFRCDLEQEESKLDLCLTSLSRPQNGDSGILCS